MTPTEALRELRATFRIVHLVATHQSNEAYMSIPADPKRDADLRHDAAVDVLEAWLLAERRNIANWIRQTREADGFPLDRPKSMHDLERLARAIERGEHEP